MHTTVLVFGGLQQAGRFRFNISECRVEGLPFSQRGALYLPHFPRRHESSTALRSIFFNENLEGVLLLLLMQLHDSSDRRLQLPICRGQTEVISQACVMSIPGPTLRGAVFWGA